MAIYEYVDPTAVELKNLFWSLVPVVAEQAGVTEEDAVFHMRRLWVDEIKAIKITHGVDYREDGRAAAWRVRLMLWRIGPQGQRDLHADSDLGSRFDRNGPAPGQTVIYGLPAVAEWVNELCTAAHSADSVIEGISVETLLRKIRSLRVALSNAGGEAMWRVRYDVITAPLSEQAPAHANPLRAISEAREPGSQHFEAHVYVMREESPRHK